MGSELGGPLVVPMSPPLPLLQESPTFWQRQARRLAAPLGGTQPAAFSITTLEHPLPAHFFSSAGRLGCLVVQFCQAPLHPDKNSCMPAWLEHTLCVLLGRGGTRWAQLLRHRGKHFPSLSSNPHCQDSEQHAPASAAVLSSPCCRCPLAA